MWQFRGTSSCDSEKAVAPIQTASSAYMRAEEFLCNRGESMNAATKKGRGENKSSELDAHRFSTDRERRRDNLKTENQSSAQVGALAELHMTHVLYALTVNSFLP
jgi:hypothetical protein